VVRVFVAAALLSGCYRPAPPQGAPCTTTSECPDPLSCSGGACVLQPIDAAIDAPIDADLDCNCAGSDLVCPDQTTACPAGCTLDSGPRCVEVVPSNGVVGDFPATPVAITITGIATFDTDTGFVNGVISRPIGTGVKNNIGFDKLTFMGANLGVFSVSALAVTSTGTIRFIGARAAVFIVQGDATISGTIDGTGGCHGTSKACAGPGGGTGGTFATAATGCGPGGAGKMDAATGADTGGGGGGGGIAGAAGGIETASATNFPGGTAGAACITSMLQPLVGGSGGGGGGPGGSATPTSGGGGGGALQLTAFDRINVDGVITMGGAGGDTGPTDATNGGAGGGGGAGGAILLEAPSVTVTGTLAANGGGGGGASDHLVAGAAGTTATANAIAAPGGAAANAGTGDGGAGGALNKLAVKGGASTDVNSGAGGGGVGRIFVRTLVPPAFSGTSSPAAGTGSLPTR
jgi:hypothetical protein